MKKRDGNYHHGDLRRTLLEYGLSLLEKQDGADLGLRELARLAGVSPGAAYRHFANKEELLVELAIEGFSRLKTAQLDAYRESFQLTGSALEAFRAGGLAYVRFALNYPALFRLMFGRFSAIHGSTRLADASRGHGETLMKGVSAIFGPEPDIEHVRVCQIEAWSVIHGLSSLLIDHQLLGEADEIEGLAKQVICEGSRWEVHPEN